MRLYRNIYVYIPIYRSIGSPETHMSIQEIREGSGKQWGSRREEKTRRNGKNKKDTPSYFLCKKEKLWFCAATRCPTVLQERAWQYLKGMDEWRIAWGSVGASSLGSSSGSPSPWELLLIAWTSGIILKWHNLSSCHSPICLNILSPRHVCRDPSKPNHFIYMDVKFHFVAGLHFFPQLLTVQLVLVGGRITICESEGWWHRGKGDLRALNIWPGSWAWLLLSK